jgi:hypothetical protein
MTEKTITCPSTGKPKPRPVVWDDDAQAYITTKQCPDCGNMFTVIPE